MRQAKFFISTAFLLALNICVSAQKSKLAKVSSLSAGDKTAIIKQVFNDGFEKLMKNSDGSAFQTCLISIVANEKIIFISTEIEKEFIKPKFDGYRFVVMPDSRMSEQVQREKGECYLRLTQSITSNSKVRFSLARYFRLPAYIYGIGFQYEFEKVGSNWQKKLLRNYRIDS